MLKVTGMPRLSYWYDIILGCYWTISCEHVNMKNILCSTRVCRKLEGKNRGPTTTNQHSHAQPHRSGLSTIKINHGFLMRQASSKRDCWSVRLYVCPYVTLFYIFAKCTLVTSSCISCRITQPCGLLWLRIVHSFL